MRQFAFCSAPSLHQGRAPKLDESARCRSRMSVHPVSSRVTRRELIRFAGLAGAALGAQGAHAAMYAPEVQGQAYSTKGDPNKIETYLPQIKAGYTALVDLEENWDSKTKNYDGDTVRRVLGTVGVTSPLFNIRKTFLKAWQLAADSPKLEVDAIEEMDTNWNLVMDGISAIDYQAYSVSFTELLATKDSLFAQARVSLKDVLEHYKAFVVTLEQAI